MLSCGMLTSLADSIAALRRRLPLGSPPPCLAATVISRRIFEKSFPRWTSALPFLRLIWDHRECPDMSSPPLLDGCFQSLDARQPAPAPLLGQGPAPLLPRAFRSESLARPRPQIGAQVDEGQVCGAGMPDLARPGHFGQDLDAHLERRAADVVERRLEGDDLVGGDGRVEVEGVETGGHDVAVAVAHGQDAARLVDVHEEDRK